MIATLSLIDQIRIQGVRLLSCWVHKSWVIGMPIEQFSQMRKCHLRPCEVRKNFRISPNLSCLN